ncbi:MAG: hypothetical protein ACK4OM_02645 [Alphaproteobacteria bacterium]
MKKRIINFNYASPKENHFLLGHESAKNEILESFKNNSAAHAWLITGSQGIGKASLVYDALKKIFIQNIHDSYKKNSILSQIISGSYGNLMVIEKKDENKDISIEEIRKIKDFLYLSASDSPYKIVVIDAVDYLNNNSSNALLKILEEPPSNSYIFLINHAEAKIHKTIKSRCRIIRLQSLTHELAQQIIKNLDNQIDDSSIDKLLYLTDNSPGQSLELWKNNALDLYEDLTEILDIREKLNINLMQKFSDKIHKLPKDIGWQIFSSLINHFLQKLLKFASSVSYKEIAKDEGVIIENISNKLNIDQWLIIWDKQQELLKETIKSNLDAKQVILIIVNLIRENRF